MRTKKEGTRHGAPKSIPTENLTKNQLVVQSETFTGRLVEDIDVLILCHYLAYCLQAGGLLSHLTARVIDGVAVWDGLSISRKLGIHNPTRHIESLALSPIHTTDEAVFLTYEDTLRLLVSTGEDIPIRLIEVFKSRDLMTVEVGQSLLHSIAQKQLTKMHELKTAIGSRRQMRRFGRLIDKGLDAAEVASRMKESIEDVENWIHLGAESTRLTMWGLHLGQEIRAKEVPA